jgi:hypothetical protein
MGVCKFPAKYRCFSPEERRKIEEEADKVYEQCVQEKC